jgi:hypothetical protein
MTYKIDILESAKRDVHFSHYRKDKLYYYTHDDILFAVPIEDAGDGTFQAREKGALMIRYMRKHNKDCGYE